MLRNEKGTTDQEVGARIYNEKSTNTTSVREVRPPLVLVRTSAALTQCTLAREYQGSEQRRRIKGKKVPQKYLTKDLNKYLKSTLKYLTSTFEVS